MCGARRLGRGRRRRRPAPRRPHARGLRRRIEARRHLQVRDSARGARGITSRGGGVNRRNSLGLPFDGLFLNTAIAPNRGRRGKAGSFRGSLSGSVREQLRGKPVREGMLSGAPPGRTLGRAGAAIGLLSGGPGGRPRISGRAVRRRGGAAPAVVHAHNPAGPRARLARGFAGGARGPGHASCCIAPSNGWSARIGACGFKGRAAAECTGAGQPPGAKTRLPGAVRLKLPRQRSGEAAGLTRPALAACAQRPAGPS